MKLKGIVINFPTFPAAPVPKFEEKGPDFGDEYYNSLFVGVPRAERRSWHQLSKRQLIQL